MVCLCPQCLAQAVLRLTAARKQDMWNRLVLVEMLTSLLDPAEMWACSSLLNGWVGSHWMASTFFTAFASKRPWRFMTGLPISSVLWGCWSAGGCDSHHKLYWGSVKQFQQLGTDVEGLSLFVRYSLWLPFFRRAKALDLGTSPAWSR